MLNEGDGISGVAVALNAGLLTLSEEASCLDREERNGESERNNCLFSLERPYRDGVTRRLRYSSIRCPLRLEWEEEELFEESCCEAFELFANVNVRGADFDLLSEL